MLGMWKDELAGFPMKEFIGITPKSYAYLQDNDKIGRRAEGVKECVTKKNIRFSYYKDCLINNKKIMRSEQVFKSERHVVSTIHAYRTNVGKICKNELLTKVKRVD